MSALSLRTYDSLVAINLDRSYVGFHSANLEVAEISREAWDSILDMKHATTAGASAELSAWNQARSTFSENAPRKHVFVVNVTQVCNLQCKYCAAGGDGSYGDPIKRIVVQETIPQLEFLMGRVQHGESLQINFFGGEPLLYPEGMRVLADAARRLAIERNIPLEFTVITNGTLITEETLGVLKDLRAHVTISLDGPPEVNDVRRPSRGGRPTTAAVLGGLSLLLAHKQSLGRIGINSVFGQTSPTSEMPNLVQNFEFVSQFPVDWISFEFDIRERSIEANEAFKFGMGEIARICFAKGGETELRRVTFFDSLFATLDSASPVRNYCGAGKTLLAIDAANQIFACPWDISTPSKKLGTSINLDSSKIAEFSRDFVEQTDCKVCWARSLCGGGCLAIHETATGSRYRLDKSFCDRFRYLAAIGLVYYERCRKISVSDETEATHASTDL